MRASLHEGVLPRKNAVRIEELINYFPYDYAPPETSTLITRPVTPADTFESVGAAPRDTRFAAAVAAFGQLLRGGCRIRAAPARRALHRRLRLLLVPGWSRTDEAGPGPPQRRLPGAPLATQ